MGDPKEEVAKSLGEVCDEVNFFLEDFSDEIAKMINNDSRIECPTCLHRSDFTKKQIEDLKEQINSYLEQSSVEIINEVTDMTNDDPRIKCPACLNHSGIAKGCIVCGFTGIIGNPIPTE